MPKPLVHLMWLFTRYGFYSVVTADPSPGQRIPDPMVRARVRQHLQNLQSRFPALATLPILETPRSDYHYRLIVSKTTWADISKALAEDINYRNFKGECEDAPGLGPAYAHMLHDIWELHYKLQQRSVRD